MRPQYVGDYFLKVVRLDFLAKKYNKDTHWVEEIDNLAKIATTHLQDAYAALTHGLTQSGHLS